VRSALNELRQGAARLPGDATPVIIAPYLSPESQALCKESQAGFLDLEGNARLALGEVFIVKRTLPYQNPSAHRATAPWQARGPVADRLSDPTSGRRASPRRAEA
jgi:hypothetical protein